MFFLPPVVHKIFRYYFFSETQKVCPTVFFDTVRYQLFDGKLWCHLVFHPRLSSMAVFFRNIERTMYNDFRHCETKDFQQKLVISPSYAKDVSIPEFFRNTEGVPYENFWRFEAKFFQLKIVICRSYAWNSSISDFFWNTEGFPYESFLVMWDQSFEQISWYTPLLLSKRFCETRISLKHRSVSPQNFSVLWEKKISTENIEIPLLSVGFFESRFFWNREGLLYQVFRDCETQTLTKNRDTHPSSLIQKHFSIPEVF